MHDEEGMQTMRTLGRNMAWIMKCIEAEKQPESICRRANPSFSISFDSYLSAR